MSYRSAAARQSQLLVSGIMLQPHKSNSNLNLSINSSNSNNNNSTNNDSGGEDDEEDNYTLVHNTNTEIIISNLLTGII